MKWLKLYREPAAVIDTPAADLTPGSASTTLDLNTPPPPAAVVPPAFVIPDAFKDKPYLKSVDSMDKVWAMLDGAQTLIGKRGPTIPAADAPQAEKDAYYESIGRPKTPAEYKLDGADKTDPKFLPKVQAALHKAGISQDTAKGLWADVNTALGEFMTEKGLLDQQNDVDFNKLATDTFGVERDRVIARGKELIEANISPVMKDALKKLDNNALVVLADVMRNLDKKYIKSDGAPNGQPPATGSSVDELRNQAKLLMVEQGKVSAVGTEWQVLQTKIDGIYDQIRRGAK